MFLKASLLFLLTTVAAHAQSVLHAEQYPGVDAGEKISRCIDALPATGGVCDARNLAGDQTSQSGFTVGTPVKPVELMLGPITLLTKGTIHIRDKSSIVGMPAGMGIGTYQSASVIKAADQSQLGAVVQMDGPLSVLQDVTVDGNKKGAPGGGTAILVSNANRVEIFRVTAQNAPRYGIQVFSSQKNESCCAKLTRVMCIANGDSGLHVANTTDIFISLSEFEENAKYGIEINSSAGLRLEHSDVGGSGEDGIRLYGRPEMPSDKDIIVGNQFGYNTKHDINIVGFYYKANKHSSGGHLISNNEFIGSARRPAGYDAIHIVDSGDNLIVSNSFFATRRNPYRFCISIEGSHELPDQINNNYCEAVREGGKGDYTGTANTVLSGNSTKEAISK